MARAVLDRPEVNVVQAPSWETWITRLTWATLLIGIAWRVGRYLAQFPVWGDEARLAINFRRDFWDMTGQLDYGQVAPVLFLWLEWLAFHVLGPSELSLRLFPLLAGIAGLLLFRRFCLETMPAWAAALAIGLLAVSYYPVRHATEIKPYSFDLLMAMALLLPAVRWAREPERTRWLIVLSLVTPLAVAGSYPAVFVAGAVNLYLLPAAWASSWRGRGWYIVFNLALVTTFLAHLLLVAREQLDPRAGAVASYLQRYWQDAFPPADLLQLPVWLIRAHAGNMLAYPAGGANWGSTATLLLCLAGMWALWRTKRGDLLTLCLTPFALTLVAAFAHRYPYGGSARLAQHLAPAICILAAFGVVQALSCLPRRVWQERWVAILLVMLGAFGLGAAVFSLARPYKTLGDLRIREMAENISRQAAEGDQLIVFSSDGGMRELNIGWYLWLVGRPIIWDGKPDWPTLDAGQQRLWGIHLRYKEDQGRPDLAQLLAGSGVTWKVALHRSYVFPADSKDVPIQYCEVFRWERD